MRISNSASYPSLYLLPFLLTAILGLAFSSCTFTNTKSDSDSANNDSSSMVELPAVYHADNDIAMMLHSVADALHQEEELDSLDYNYEGILTDGTGRSLYTDVQGAPGAWSIRVENPNSIAIKNIYLGDLLPDALQAYILESFELNTDDVVDTSKFKNKNLKEAQIYYNDGVYLIFQTQTSSTSTGKEGPLMTIVVTSIAPEEG